MLRFRSLSDVRWYLYRSATKLDMLYNQFAQTSRRLTGNVSIEVPGLKASFGTPNDESPSVEEQWALVERELRKRNLVGTIQEPKEYFAGKIPMRWGLFDDQGNRPQGDAPLVFFGGIDRAEEIIVGLGGSSVHVVGHEGATSTYSRSTSPAIVSWILAGLADAEPQCLWGDPEGERQQVLQGVAIALHYLRPPTLTLQFLAKTLLAGKIWGHEHMTGLSTARGLLGTPLYVCMVDPPGDESRWGLDDQW
ncbi:MAG TPA: SAVMC3_10250 family protein [Longimicrobium sp.]|nr:SAVMC3_10250 family protein [Longimicrobium sp.]